MADEIAARIGIDLGGTKIEGLALRPGGEEVARERMPTPGDYDAVLAAIAALVTGLEEAAGPATVGVGHPGTISPATGLIKNANSTMLNGRRFHVDLEAALARPVRMSNDANCLALSEATDGAAAGARVVLAVILGTGMGSGVVVDGRVVEGANAITGEFGHNPLPWPRPGEYPGPACWCGRDGCAERFLSGTGMARDFAAVTGRSLSSEEIVARAGEGDARAAEALDRYVDRLGRALAAAINLLDPHVVVLGGGMSNVAALYPRVPDEWRRWVFSDEVATVLRRAEHGDSSGVRGAAWLWPEPP